MIIGWALSKFVFASTRNSGKDILKIWDIPYHMIVNIHVGLYGRRCIKNLIKKLMKQLVPNSTCVFMLKDNIAEGIQHTMELVDSSDTVAGQRMLILI